MNIAFFWLLPFIWATPSLTTIDSDTVTVYTKPRWSSSYYVEGDIFVPLAEMHEQFSAWYDSESRKSRIDYHHGRTITYQLSNERSSDLNLKILQITTVNETDFQRCIEANTTDEFHVSPQPTLPDLSDYRLINQNIKNGIEIETWAYIKRVSRTVVNYKMYLYRQNDIVYPLEFNTNAFNTVFKSDYDSYTIKYNQFIPVKLHPNIFNTNELKCESFPVPGVNHSYDINPMMEFINNDKDFIDSIFDEFKKQYNKSYTFGTLEHFVRLNNFRQNLRYIRSKNRADVTYTLALNHLADYSNTELKSFLGYRELMYCDVENNDGKPFPYNKNYLQNLPSEIDWRNSGAVTGVKDQSKCHSSWSLCVIDVTEGAYFKKHGESISFSEQALIDCSWDCGNMGCKRGRISNTYSWIKTNGLPTDKEYGPYLAKDSSCYLANISNDHLTKITSFVNVTTYDEGALKIALVYAGPIAISIDVSPKSFAFYSNGVYYDKDCRNSPLDLNHAVLLVGYGTLNGYPYWLVKNSWSTRWGKDGYILISRRDNNCGVLTNPTYVIL